MSWSALRQRWTSLDSDRRRRLAPPLLAAVLGLAGLGWWLAPWGIEETDNAQLEAHLVEIASRVSGTIEQVAVEENQSVQRGQVLLVLDRRDALVRVAQA